MLSFTYLLQDEQPMGWETTGRLMHCIKQLVVVKS